MQQALPTILVVVGVTGDLSHRKLLPSLYNLENDNLLPKDFRILGTTRRGIRKSDLMRGVKKYIINSGQKVNQKKLDKLFSRLKVSKINLTKAESYHELAKILDEMEHSMNVCTGRLFYLAVPSEAMPKVADLIGHKEVHKCHHGEAGRILIEKPFGRDLKSAQVLSDILDSHFSEEQIYRIDHYLAKETTQNIIHFRFSNPLVEDLWNSHFIDHIQITATESIGIEGRANFYDNTGALRDMVQSHMLQLLALTTMNKPYNLDVENVRREREKVLSLLRIFRGDKISSSVLRGQYSNYKRETGLNSRAETYVALKVEVNNQQWRGVPIYIRTGKGLTEKRTEISLVYKGDKPEDINVLTIRIQPNEGISLKLRAKKPGLQADIRDIVMDYGYGKGSDRIRHTAYEKLIVDAMRGDQMLFPSTFEVINSWKFIDPILKYWLKSKNNPEIYPFGSQGPKSADKLIASTDDEWIT